MDTVASEDGWLYWYLVFCPFGWRSLFLTSVPVYSFFLHIYIYMLVVSHRHSTTGYQRPSQERTRIRHPFSESSIPSHELDAGKHIPKLARPRHNPLTSTAVKKRPPLQEENSPTYCIPRREDCVQKYNLSDFSSWFDAECAPWRMTNLVPVWLDGFVLQFPSFLFASFPFSLFLFRFFLVRW